MNQSTRRQFLQFGAAATASLSLPIGTRSTFADQAVKSPNERWRVGAIGMRYQGSVITRQAQAFGDINLICDVDRHVLEQARASFNSSAKIVEDYHDLISSKDIDVVLIGAPDHWHAKMAIDACRAGKDVYLEKPISLTIEEGRAISRVAAETGRVVQVGTWQRHDQRFRLAAEMIRAGRLGKVTKATIVLGKNLQGGPFAQVPIPKQLNWDRWLGQAPMTPYIPERCHYTFRFWYDYAGGEMTDTGAHHVDIAMWALGLDNTGPTQIIPQGKLPNVVDGYNVAKDFSVQMKFANGVEFAILDTGRNGILFEGELGRIFVNRGIISGTPVDELKSNPLPRESFQVYAHDNLSRPERAGKYDALINHMGNFYDCVQSRKTPISSVESQHRVATTCHLGNLALRLGRTLNWNPDTERFINDAEADTYLRREQRKGYEVV